MSAEHNPPRGGDKIKPPWTTAQVEALNRFQANGTPSAIWLSWQYWHPFTCPLDLNHFNGNYHEASLVATEAGWVCELADQGCDYTQDWAWAFMAGLATPYTEQETTKVEERPDDDPAPVATCNGRDCGGRPHA